MVRATRKVKKKANNNKDESLDASKAFAGLDFNIPSFKKKANNSLLSTSSKPTKKTKIKTFKKKTKNVNNKTIKHKSLLLPFMKLYSNKPKVNYTNKSSHLATKNDSNTSNVTIFKTKRKNKSVKRKQRKKQLVNQIETNMNWKMTLNPNDNDKSTSFWMDDIDIKETKKQNNNKNNDDEFSFDNSSMQSLMDSLKHTENEIIMERKKMNKKKQMEHDKNNITALFKNDDFDLNPIAFTKNAIKNESSLLNMKTDKELKKEKYSWLLNGGNNKNNKRNKKNKSNKNRNNSSLQWNKQRNGNSLKKSNKTNDDNLKKQIAKELQNMKKQKNKKNTKLNLSKKKKTKLKNPKNKLLRKMTLSQKSKQKKRRWRV